MSVLNVKPMSFMEFALSIFFFPQTTQMDFTHWLVYNVEAVVVSCECAPCEQSCLFLESGGIDQNRRIEV